jgi:hypothetical protein
MATIREIVDSVADFAAGRVTAEDFEDWAADLSWNAHTDETPQVREIAYKIRALLVRHESDMDQQYLIRDLENAIRSFARRSSEFERVAYVELGAPKWAHILRVEPAYLPIEVQSGNNNAKPRLFQPVLRKPSQSESSSLEPAQIHAGLM